MLADPCIAGGSYEMHPLKELSLKDLREAMEINFYRNFCECG